MRYAIRSISLAAWLAVLAAYGCGSSTGVEPDTALVPLTDMGARTYLGFEGGLYPDGADAPPASHHAEGLARAAAIRPLTVDGQPSDEGEIVLVSIGMSNTTQEFCSHNSALPCDPWTFMGQAAVDPAVSHTTLAIVNGARGSEPAETWDAPDDANYDRVRDTRLAPQGLTEAQVQIAWVKVANPRPTVSLPAPEADAFRLVTQMGDIARALKARYANLQQVFFSSRIYAGYATTTLNPEPYAYESGFAVKWLVQAQIDQMENEGVVVDARAGDLSYESAPWLAWGPYLWADGANPRSDGLLWVPADFATDGTHPAQSAEEKVGTLLLESFKTSPYTTCWFLADACP